MALPSSSSSSHLLSVVLLAGGIRAKEEEEEGIKFPLAPPGGREREGGGWIWRGANPLSLHFLPT